MSIIYIPYIFKSTCICCQQAASAFKLYPFRFLNERYKYRFLKGNRISSYHSELRCHEYKQTLQANVCHENTVSPREYYNSYSLEVNWKWHRYSYILFKWKNELKFQRHLLFKAVGIDLFYKYTERAEIWQVL